ncbi:hypothetical protein GIB67_006686 [Kingdonia uniflora]|uniref:Uncharacterized protein n=1 Tax=Kingdonia uniflora TaxID=39325 RepID=A0A7J7LAZ9_9MAGN|nr:hypothetical protein GIB67_006686 [Kingdonia uniflora]
MRARPEESTEEQVERLSFDNARRRRARAEETTNEKTKRLSIHNARQRRARAEKTQDERAERLALVTARRRMAWAEETPEVGCYNCHDRHHLPDVPGYSLMLAQEHHPSYLLPTIFWINRGTLLLGLPHQVPRRGMGDYRSFFHIHDCYTRGKVSRGRYRCIVRYGYQDIHKDDLEFENYLVCSIAKFIRSGKTEEPNGKLEDSEKNDERMIVVGTFSTNTEGIHICEDDVDPFEVACPSERREIQVPQLGPRK